MAKKKAEVPAVETAVVESPENVPTAVETTQETTEEVVEQPQPENSEEMPEAQVEQPADQVEKPKASAAKKAPVEKDIPANVQSILKAFYNMPELYVSTTGRVFSPSAKPSLRGNAILYKNPFYNSKS